MVYNTTDTIAFDKNASDLCAGIYAISITDFMGCRVDTNFSIQGAKPGEIFFHGGPSVCGNNNGFIKLDSAKNIDADGYLKLNGQLYRDSIGGLAPGKYVFEYLSAQGACSVVDSILIPHANGPSLTTAFVAPSCFENQDALAYVDHISGGEAPYSYVWNTGETTDSISNKSAGFYSLTVTDKNGCTVSSSVNIGRPDKLNITLESADTSICFGDSVLIQPSISSIDAIKELNINGKAYSGEKIFLHAGLHRVSAVSVKGCKSDTLPIEITHLPELSFDLLAQQTEFCPGDTFELNLTNITSAGPMDIDWENGLGSDTSFSKKVKVSDHERYFMAMVKDACTAQSDSIKITVKQAPTLALNNFNNSGCEPLAFSVFDSLDNHAQYFLNDAPVSAYETRNLSAGSYNLRVIVSNGTCATDSTILNAIEVYALPEVSIISTPSSITTLYPNAQFTDASVPPLATKNWSIIRSSMDTILRSVDKNLEHTFPAIAQEYKIELEGYTAHGCYGRTRIYIAVKDEFHVFVPNSFTPNGDGNNDYFAVQLHNIDVATYKLEIVDRWGKLIYETDDPKSVWNGNHFNSDAAAPIGVYNWKITILDTEGRYIPKIGHLNLIR